MHLPAATGVLTGEMDRHQGPWREAPRRQASRVLRPQSCDLWELAEVEGPSPELPGKVTFHVRAMGLPRPRHNLGRGGPSGNSREHGG